MKIALSSQTSALLESFIMRILTLLCCVWLASAGTVPEKCDGVTFDGKYYDKELLTAVKLAVNLSYQKGTNTLFFSYTKPTNKTEDNFTGVAYYNIDTKEFKDIPEVIGGSATGIDTETDEVYLGGSNGIQKFNPQTKRAEPFAAEGDSIYYLYYDYRLFYITLPNFEIHRCDGPVSKNTPHATVEVEKLIGDGERYYFVNKTGLFGMLGGKVETAVKLADADQNDYVVFARDNNEKIFVVRQGGVYVPNRQDKKLDKVADITGVHGLAFDKDNNIIYSDTDNIYKLTPSLAKYPLP